jgi:tetratricopeptide (TPR) repeat protein
MASVFLSYDHEDYARAATVAAALEAHGHSVWWDRHIHGGAEYNTEIESAVARSDAVVVLWSDKSVRSAWVRDEAAEGRDAGKLVPVLIDAVKPPMGFRQYQTLDLTAWTGRKRPQLAELLEAIAKVAQPEAAGRAEPAVATFRKSPTMPAAASIDVSRRLLIGGGAATAATALVSGSVWWWIQQREDPRFEALIVQSEEAIRHQNADEGTARALERAVSMQPNSPKALGLLALIKSLMAVSADPKDAPRRVQEAERIALRALSINAKEPNALLAMFELQGATIDWFARDQKLRQIIAIDPKSVTAIAELVLLTQAVGYVHESWDWNERAVALEPLSADYLAKRALKLWILGRPADADKVIDQVRALYPADPWVWFVRMHIYLFTGRVRAARAMLQDDPNAGNRKQLAAVWDAPLAALDEPTPEKIAKARDACIDGAQVSSLFATEAVLIMCALKDLDTAFDIANEFLLSRGPLVRAQEPGLRNGEPQVAWRTSTQWMFTPPAAPMRADPRFLPLCDGVGLTDFWRKRGLKPDYQRT